MSKLKLANIATVKVNGRNELHLKFNNEDELREAYCRITRAELPEVETKLRFAAEQFVAAHKDQKRTMTRPLLDYFADIFEEALK